MKIKVFSMDSNWSMDAVLIKETEKKIMVWSNPKLSIEMHFPKHLFYYKPIEDAQNEE